MVKVLFKNINTFLVLCRPFSPNGDASSIPINYFFIDPDFIDPVSIINVSGNYSHVFIEENLVPLFNKVISRIPSKVIPIGNITVDSRPKERKERIAFLVSSDTHANFMLGIANFFEEVFFLIPDRRCKDDGAADALTQMGFFFEEIDYAAQKSEALEQFNPDLIFCGADWTSEFIAVQRIVKDRQIPLISLQEGPQDWHMKFWQEVRGQRVLKVLNHYRNSDIFFAQGAVTLNYIRPKYFAVTGNPKINSIEMLPKPLEPKVLINCNFTYIKTKPPYENNREMWMQGVLKVCKDLQLPYIISKHPRDESTWDDPNLIESNAFKIRDQLASCGVVVSRFSSILYEALALGRHAVYYNPHGEPMLTFTEDVHGMVLLANNEGELYNVLKSFKEGLAFDPDKNMGYLHRHVGPQDGKALDRIVSILKTLTLYKPGDLGSIKKQMHFPADSRHNIVIADRKRNIVIFVRNSAIYYSEGRYYALAMAEALAALGHKVYFVTENLPIFFSDFRKLGGHQNIEICLTKDYMRDIPGLEDVDLVFCVPGMDNYYDFYAGAVNFAKKHRSPLALFNFETPNWFNSLAPSKRDEKLWYYWDAVSEHCSLILSSTRESVKYARKIFIKCHSSVVFRYCYPAINNIVADSIPDFEKEKRIILITRFLDSAHKGGFSVADILMPCMKGYTIVLIVGTGNIPDGVLRSLKSRASEIGIGVEVIYRISDYEKFVEFKKSCLLLFPSFFEGFGYPPIEAIYCNTPCIAFDLPVLRETCKDNLTYVPMGDWEKFRGAIEKELGAANENRDRNYRGSISGIARFENYMRKLNEIVEYVCSRDVDEAVLNKPIPSKEAVQMEIVPPEAIVKETVPPGRNVQEGPAAKAFFYPAKKKSLAVFNNILSGVTNQFTRYLPDPAIVQKEYTFLWKLKFINYALSLKREFKDIHKGREAFLLGNGPSVRIEDFQSLTRHVTFACNRFYLCYDKTNFRPTYLVSSDRQMVADYGKEMSDKAECPVFFNTADEMVIGKNVYWIPSTHPYRAPLVFQEKIHRGIFCGGATLISAIQIAYFMGIRRFYLYGVDHSFKFDVVQSDDIYRSAVGDANHFIPNYRSGKNWCPPATKLIEDSFQICDEFLRLCGGFIKNATRGGKLEVLERVDFDEVVKGV